MADRAAAWSCGPRLAASCGRHARRSPARPDDHDRRGPVDRRERRRAGQRRAVRPPPPSAWTAIIAPPVRQRAHQPAARRDQRARVGQREDARPRARRRSRRSSGRPRQSGVDPHDSSSRNSATSTANSAGWVMPVRSSALAAEITSRNGAPVGPAAPAPRRARPRTPGSARTAPAPMPARCAPWPVNRNASLARPGEPSSTSPARSPAPARPAPSSGSPPTTAARCSNCEPAAWPAPAATSASDTLGVARQPRPQPLAPARAARPRSCPTSTTRQQRAGTVRELVADRRLRRLLEDHVRVGAADRRRTTRRRGAGGSPRGHAIARAAAARTSPAVPVDVRATARRRAASAAAARAGAPCTILITPATPAAACGVADVGLHRAEPQRVDPARSTP